MADTKISDLATADPLDGSELLLLSQSAADKQVDLDTLRSDLDWIRPADWPAMPATAANTMHLLCAVFDTPNNRVAIRMSTSAGTWSVNWGDGTSDSGIASNTTIEHLYDFSDVDLPAATSRGYKVAIVTVTADSGNFTVFNPCVALSGYNTNYVVPWLEMQVNGSALTTLTLAPNPIARMCEYVNFVAIGTVTSVLFTNWHNLRKIDEPGTLFSNITSWQNMFLNCTMLRRLDLSGMAAGVTNMSSAFLGCGNLKSLVFPSGTLASVTNAAGCFNGCAALETISFPSGAWGAVLDASSMFASCARLRELTLPSGAFASATTGASTFTAMNELERLVIPSGAFVNATTFASMFASSFGLVYLEFLGAVTTSLTTIATMLNDCRSLRHIKFASGSFGSVTTTTNAFNAASVQRIENLSIPVSFSIASLSLLAAQLDEIYTALPTITSQTITVTGNPGTSGDTPSIATGKGWTVTG